MSSLTWSPDVAEIVVVVVILEEDVDSLEGNMAHLVIDRVALIRDPGNVSIVTGIITYLRNSGRNLIVLNGHNWLVLTLLHLMFLMFLQPLSLFLLVLSLCHRTSMINYVNSSSLRAIIQ